MSPKYDLFERFPDGSSLWRACVVSLEGARLHMKDMARRSQNQFYAMHVRTGKIELFRDKSGELAPPANFARPSSVAAA